MFVLLNETFKMSPHGGPYDNFNFWPYGRGSLTFGGPGDQNFMEEVRPYIRSPPCTAKKPFLGHPNVGTGTPNVIQVPLWGGGAWSSYTIAAAAELIFTNKKLTT